MDIVKRSKCTKGESLWERAGKFLIRLDMHLPYHLLLFRHKVSGVGCHFLLQEIFLIQGLNPGLPHCRQTLLPSEPPGKRTLKILFIAALISWGALSLSFLAFLQFGGNVLRHFLEHLSFQTSWVTAFTIFLMYPSCPLTFLSCFYFFVLSC